MKSHQLTATLPTVLRQASRAAAQFCRRHAEPLIEQDDVRQDLLLDLLTRLDAFDPARGSLATFSATCFQHRATRLAERLRRDRQARHPLALDAPPPGKVGPTLLDTIAEQDGYGAWIGQPSDQVAHLELRLDLDRALSTTSPQFVQVCAFILQPSPGTPRSSMARSTMHRRVRELRCRVLAAGIERRARASQREGT